MRNFVFVILFLYAGISGVGAGDRKDGVSASGKIRWQVVRVDDNGISEVLISEAGQGESAPYKLCEAVSVGNTKVSVAPDDSWIIVQTGGASLGISLTVFHRENGMIYKEMPGLDIGAEVLLSACGADLAKADAMDHVYVDVSGWSKDSSSVLVGLNAGGGKGEVRDFFAIYDLAGRKVGFDLAKFNAARPAERGR